MREWTDPAQQRARRTPRGQNIFTNFFVDINNTHTSNILAFGGIGSTTRRVSFSGYLHTNSMQVSKNTNSSKNAPFCSKIFYKHMLIYIYIH
jgi:hypothetical protein